MIKFENITKVLSGRKILDDLSFEIKESEIFIVVGSSGMGKSVTLKHIARLMTPDDGRILIDGEDIHDAGDGRELEKIRDKFGYLFQGGALLAWLSISENVALPLREKTSMEEDEIVDKVYRTLKMVGLENDGNKKPSEVSGGMCKRAGLARAIIRDPKIVLYDEPTSGLDPVTSRVIDELIDHLREEIGVTSVVVTHDLHSALSIGDRIAMLHNGKFVELASPKDFIHSSNQEVENFLKAQYITKQGSWKGY